MAPKKGNGVPKRGNGLPLFDADAATVSYEKVILDALQRALGGRRYTAKTLMRWTGVSARTAKHWLAGSASPSGVHLIALMRNSDEVFEAALELAGRGDFILPDKMDEFRRRLHEARMLLDSAIELTSAESG